MKRFLCLGLLSALGLSTFASQALAQAASFKAVEGSEVAVVFQGDTVAACSDDTSFTPIPAFPATVVLCSVATPSKYKPAKQSLTIHSTAQWFCPGDAGATIVTVGGFAAPPDTTGAFFFECSDGAGDEGFQTRGRGWFFPPGAPIGLPAIISLIATSGVGGSTVFVRELTVVSHK